MRSQQVRLQLAQRLCRHLPPLISPRIRIAVYPQQQAFQDDLNFIVKAQTGSLFSGSTGDFHSYPFSIHGFYDWRNWAVALAVTKPGDTIVEVGANVGTETVGYRDIIGPSGQVHAFEPMPSNMDALNNIIELNNWTNVTIHPIALGNKHETANFVLPEHDWASGIGHLAGPEVSAESRTIEVKVIPLDSLKEDLGALRAIFIDTEGAEVDVLTGGQEVISHYRPIIVLEAAPNHLNRAGKSIAELCTVLANLNYQSWEITRFGLTSPQKIHENKNANWVCLPKENVQLRSRIVRFIRLCGILPCIAGLNPLTRKTNRERIQIFHRGWA